MKQIWERLAFQQCLVEGSLSHLGGPSEGDGALGEEPAVREAWKGLCRMMAAAWWEMEGRGPQG